MNLFCFLILSVVISNTFPGEAHRILGVFPFNGKSHFAMFERLMKELANRGHQVDVVSHFPLKNHFPNYTDVGDLSGTSLMKENNLTYERARLILIKGSLTHVIAKQFGNTICDLLAHPDLQKVIKNRPGNPPYDIIVTEIFGAKCYLALGQHLNVPVVGIVTSPMFPWINDIVGNPDNPAYIPHTFLGFDGRMDFWQRIRNTLSTFATKWLFDKYISVQDEQIKKYIGPHALSVKAAEQNVSLILVNSHYSLNGVRPFTPAVVEVGGLHIDDSNVAVQKDLQKWLDGSKDGFVYISFGSMLNIESFPKESLYALYASVAKLAPIRVLLKIGNLTQLPPGLPNNVLTLSWIPQLAILKHKNVRAFMTHGGLMGIQEAVYYGVPMIGVPLFGDQLHNIKACENRNIVVVLDYKELNEKNLDTVFHAVLHDPSYTKAVKQISAQFKDRPMSPLDTAVFWIEHVIRWKGTSLRSPVMDLAWWEVALLDVYGALLLAVVVFGYFLKLMAIKIIKLIINSEVGNLVGSKKFR